MERVSDFPSLPDLAGQDYPPPLPTPGAATLRGISQETKLRTRGQVATYQPLPLEAAVPRAGLFRFY